MPVKAAMVTLLRGQRPRPCCAGREHAAPRIVLRSQLNAAASMQLAAALAPRTAHVSGS
jgi:hypothetical protein